MKGSVGAGYTCVFSYSYIDKGFGLVVVSIVVAVFKQEMDATKLQPCL